MTGKVEERVAVHGKKLEKLIEDLKEKDSDKEEKQWYRDLKGSLPYEKLKSQRSFCNRRIKVYV